MLKALATNLKNDTFSEFLIANGYSVLTGTMMFMNYHESMIKTAARTVILSIFTCIFYIVKLVNIKEYIVQSGFFNCFVSLMSDKVSLCDRYILSLNASKLESSLSENLEDLYYINDIFELHIPEFNEILATLLIKNLIFPIIIGSLGSIQHNSFHISIPLAAVYLYQTLRIIKNADFTNCVVMGLLVKTLPAEFLEFLQDCPSPNLRPNDDYLYQVNLMLEYLEGFSEIENLGENPIPDVIFSFLTSKDNNLVGVILMLLDSVISNTSVNNNLLLAAGLISFEKIKMKKLLNFILEEKGKNMNYNENTVEILLNLLCYEEPLRVFHFSLACRVINSLVYRSDVPQCLTLNHQALLNKAFKRNISSLQEYLIDNSDYDIFFEVFEDV